MSKDIIVECIRCDWSGHWDDIEETQDGYICPKCNSIDSFIERDDDSVSDNDYRDQNPMEIPKE